VNLGPAGSRANITAATIFDSLGIHVQPTSLDQGAALQALQQKRLAALVHVSRKPAPLFFALNFDDAIHFLPVPQTPELLKIYLPSRLAAADYPLLIGQGEAGRGLPISTISVPVVIAVSNPVPGTEHYRALSLLTDTLFPLAQSPQNRAPDSLWAGFDSLNVPGWRRFPPAMARLQGGTAVGGMEQSPPSAPRHVEPRPNQSQLERQQLFEEYLRWRNTQNHR
jgi:hypothetical protein